MATAKKKTIPLKYQQNIPDYTLQPKQEEYLSATQSVVFFGGGAGGGKALAHGSKVLTPTGWKLIEDMCVGDFVVDHLGNIQTVEEVHPQGEVFNYRITFNDNRYVDACKDHLWRGWFAGKNNKELILRTEDLLTRNYKKFLVPLVSNIQMEDSEQVSTMHPYLLGVILGDGCSRGEKVSVTSEDPFIFNKIESLGYTLGKPQYQENNNSVSITILNQCKPLKQLGLMGLKSGDKYIPDSYLNGSIETRTQVLQGLIDTDGYTTKDGKVYFYSTSKKLAEGVQYIVRSLGGKATITDKVTKYKDRYVPSYVVYIHHKDSTSFASLPRKAERLRIKNAGNGISIKSIEPLGMMKATCISVSGDDKLFVTNDFIVTHNTFGSMMDNLQGIHDPLYFSVFFRTTTVEISKGLWPEAKRLYLPYLVNTQGKFIGKAKISEVEKTITFPSGARTTFAYLSNDKDADSWYGTEITKIYFEEAQFRTQYQFDVLKSRNRSMANVTKGIRCTLNPSPTSFIYDWVKPFLDEDDYPIKELSGKTRYYVVVDGVLYTDWDEQELKDRLGKDPETYTYIPATLDDNKKLEELDDTYRKKLDSMPEAKRKQLLLGCWGATEDSGIYYRRENVIKADKVPFGAQYVRGWDMASSEITANNPRVDPTMGLKMAKCKQGYYYLCGMERFFKRVGDRNAEIINVAHRDTPECTVLTAVDPAAAGRTAFEYFAKMMVEEGFTCKADPMPINASKVNKAEPFFAAVETGLVRVVESAFEKDELELFHREMESFNGERSTGLRHDESVDCAAMCFNYLSKKKVHTLMRLPTINAPSIKKQLDL